ncbi:MAG: major capsid protein [Actinomycetota bacterium]
MDDDENTTDETDEAAATTEEAAADDTTTETEEFSVPEDLTGLTDEELTGLAEGCADVAADLREAGITAENLEVAEQLADDAARVRSEQQARVERSDRFTAALASAAGDEDGEELADDTDDEELAAGEDEGEELADDTEIDDDVDGEAGTDGEELSTGRPVYTRSRREHLRTDRATYQRRRRPKVPAALAAKVPDEEPAGIRGRATANVLSRNLREGSVVDGVDQMAEVISETFNKMKVGDGVRMDHMPLVTIDREHEITLDGDEYKNFSRLIEARQQVDEALVASGAYCAPSEPIYSFFPLGDVQVPVEQSLPVVGAPRGGVRYARKGSPSATATAIDTQGPTDNTDPANPVAKAALHILCPTIEEEQVTAVSEVTLFSNLQFRTWPEQIRSFLEDVAIMFAARKERFHLDAIRTAGTDATQAAVYGAARDVPNTYNRACVAYRKRNRMARTSPMQVWAPDFTADMIMEDLLNDDEGLSIDGMMAWIADRLAERNVIPVWYDETTTAGGDRMDGAQAAGALNGYPATVPAYFAPPGSFVRLDGGTLDLGIVRDSVLNRNNDLMMFAEEWIGTIHLVTEVVEVVQTLDTTGESIAEVQAPA